MNDKVPVTAEPSLADEMKAIPFEPLLPAEIKLVVGSLSLGVVLLAALAWIVNS